MAKKKGHKKKINMSLKMGKITIWTQKPSFVHKTTTRGLPMIEGLAWSVL